MEKSPIQKGRRGRKFNMDRESPKRKEGRRGRKFNLFESPIQKGRRGRKNSTLLSIESRRSKGRRGRSSTWIESRRRKRGDLVLVLYSNRSSCMTLNSGRVYETTNDSNNSKAASCEMRVASCELRVASGKLRVRDVEFMNDEGDVLFIELLEKTQGQNPGNV